MLIRYSQECGTPQQKLCINHRIKELNSFLKDLHRSSVSTSKERAYKSGLENTGIDDLEIIRQECEDKLEDESIDIKDVPPKIWGETLNFIQKTVPEIITKPKHVNLIEFFDCDVYILYVKDSDDMDKKIKKWFHKYYGYPIQIVSDEFLFSYNLEKLGAEDDWKEFTQIVSDFDCFENFLDIVSKIKNLLIEYYTDSDAYRKFLERDAKSWPLTNTNIPSGNVWNISQVGKKFVSIDLTKANHQALFLEGIVNIREWDKVVDLICGPQKNVGEILKKSKYFRQVVFGNISPKKVVRVERYYIDIISEFIKKNDKEPGTLVRINNDELIYEVSQECDTEKLREFIFDNLDIQVKVKNFTFDAYSLYKENSKICTGYLVKSRDKHSFKCVPQNYTLLYNRILENLNSPIIEDHKFTDYDKIIECDSLTCHIWDDLEIRKETK